MTLSSRLEEINRAVEALESFGESSGFNPSTVRVVGLMLEELLSNSVTHGAMPAEAVITVSLLDERDHLLLRYIDTGPAFNPTTDLPPDTRHKKLEERPVGGLGWNLIFHYAASVEYRREADTNIYQIRVSSTQPGEW